MQRWLTDNASRLKQISQSFLTQLTEKHDVFRTDPPEVTPPSSRDSAYDKETCLGNQARRLYDRLQTFQLDRDAVDDCEGDNDELPGTKRIRLPKLRIVSCRQIDNCALVRPSVSGGGCCEGWIDREN